MILRRWRGCTRAEDAERYWEYLQETGVKEYQATPGNRGVFALRRILGESAEFVLLTLWDDMAAVRRFAGPESERAVFYREDEAFLTEFDRDVGHYEVLLAPPGIGPGQEA